MHFLDDSLFPENQEKLVITAAPYGPEWEPADFPEDIPLTMDQHVQQAVDCWEAGATVLHIHVRELDGKGSKRMSQFNELLRRLREAVPEMILHGLVAVGGSVGAYTAMEVFRHKTVKGRFRILFWCLVALQVVLIAWLVKLAWWG